MKGASGWGAIGAMVGRPEGVWRTKGLSPRADGRSAGADAAGPSPAAGRGAWSAHRPVVPGPATARARTASRASDAGQVAPFRGRWLGVMGSGPPRHWE